MVSSLNRCSAFYLREFGEANKKFMCEVVFRHNKKSAGFFIYTVDNAGSLFVLH